MSLIECLKTILVNIIEEVTEASPWVSNLVVVPKQSGRLRECSNKRVG